MTTLAVDIFLVTMMVVLAALVLLTRRLVAAIVLTAAYSLISAAMFVNLNAVDVAFTEAAVGAGVTTVLLLAAMARLPAEEKAGTALVALPLAVCLIAGALLVGAVLALPPFGDPAAPVHQHVAPRYLAESGEVLHIPNVVTTILASYRGFDTLGEVIVIFAAGLGVFLLLVQRPPRRPRARRKPAGRRRNAG